MTTSEQRLHPASILFDIARYARIFAWPALIAFLGGPRGTSGIGPWSYDTTAFETWLWVLVLPSLGLSIVRYLTFRIRYDRDELVIRSGLLFRNVRHIPYARVQNLDAVQNVFHRALGVVDVRVETGSGSEPEARLRVLPAADLDDMRARVFAGRAPTAPALQAERASATRVPSLRPEQPSLPTGVPPDAVVAEERPAPTDPPRLLLQLSTRDLILLGFLENKGMVLMGAAYGALWESGLMNQLGSRLFQGTFDARGLFREFAAFILGRGPLPAGRLALALAGLVAFLVLVRLVSMAWAVVAPARLPTHEDWGRPARDLWIVHAGGCHHPPSARPDSDRASAAGSRAGWGARRSGWRPPVGEPAAPPGTASGWRRSSGSVTWARCSGRCFQGAILPEADWQPVHPRAFRRALTPVLLVAAIASLVVVLGFGWRPLIVGSPLLVWAMVSTRQQIRNLAWLASESLVAFRSGWLSQAETIVRANRVQSVTLRESPLDRRAGMAGVRVDTAGAGERSHRVDIPYLDGLAARDLQGRLAGAAARTDFTW